MREAQIMEQSEKSWRPSRQFIKKGLFATALFCCAILQRRDAAEEGVHHAVVAGEGEVDAVGGDEVA